MKYRKKPIIVETFKYAGSLFDTNGEYCIPEWAIEAFRKNVIRYGLIQNGESLSGLYIEYKDGWQHIPVGDYIIKGIDGKIYGCNKEVFIETYEGVE